MKIELKVFLPTVAVLLFSLSLIGYADGKHDEITEIQANFSLENPTSVAASDSLVDRWLETKVAGDILFRKARSGVPASVTTYFEGEEESGKGWCDICGCWMMHGCDSNGNCDIAHFDVCAEQSMRCDLHPDRDCKNSPEIPGW